MSKPVGQQKPQSPATPVSRVQQVAVITPTGATGVVTFVASSGGAVFSKSGLRTNGQYATASLRMISPRVFTLRGELQV